MAESDGAVKGAVVGAAAGAATHSVVGSVGLAVGGTAVGVTLLPMIAVGGLIGLLVGATKK